MEKVKIGILGCGLISQYAHLFALTKAENVELTALCDVAEDLVVEMARRYNVLRWYTDYQKFLEEADIDAVLIATADQHHVPNAIACLRHEKHVLVEKPVGVNLEECKKLAEVVEETGRKLQVGNNRRFDPGIEFAHDFILHEMGERLSVSGWYCDTAVRPALQHTLRPPVMRNSKQVSFDPAFKSNKRAYKLITHGIHTVNTLRFLGGEIVALQAKFATKYDNFSWHALLEFEGGAVGHVELNIAVKMDWLEGFHVHGEKGSVVVKSFLPFFYRPSEVRAFSERLGEYRSPITPDTDPYERQVEAFARAILNDTPASPDVYDGMADLAVIRALEKSVETGERVTVDLYRRKEVRSR